MSADYFTELPPELILLLPPSLSTSSLSAFTLTCRRIREILQPELEARLTPELATQIFLWAVASDKPHIVAKLLSPPHSINLSGGAGLDIATKAGNKEIVALLLEAGADPATPWDQDGRQALHLAARNNDLEMMKLLLDHGAPIDDQWGPDGWRQNALHFACLEENIEMIDLLLSRGADLEIHGTFGTALGVAVHFRKIDAVKFLLHKGAKA
ncbi:ankyrin repeat-containing domain protein [Mycena galericulata]|nr:ankyrin repeat-containing domain protein [Mycena galericulata]